MTAEAHNTMPPLPSHATLDDYLARASAVALNTLREIDLARASRFALTTLRQLEADGQSVIINHKSLDQLKQDLGLTEDADWRLTGPEQRRGSYEENAEEFLARLASTSGSTS